MDQLSSFFLASLRHIYGLSVRDFQPNQTVIQKHYYVYKQLFLKGLNLLLARDVL